MLELVLVLVPLLCNGEDAFYLVVILEAQGW